MLAELRDADPEGGELPRDVERVGHIRVATDPAVHHFIDLEHARYLGAFIEGREPLVHWKLDGDGATAMDCSVER